MQVYVTFSSLCVRVQISRHELDREEEGVRGRGSCSTLMRIKILNG